MIKTYYCYHRNGILCSSLNLPEEKGNVKNNVTLIKPFEYSNEKAAKFYQGIWVLVDRQIQPILDKTTLIGDGVDSIKLTNLPDYYIITLDNNKYESEDSICEITIDNPGEYSLVVSSPQMIDFKTTIVAI